MTATVTVTQQDARTHALLYVSGTGTGTERIHPSIYPTFALLSPPPLLLTNKATTRHQHKGPDPGCYSSHCLEIGLPRP